MSKYRNGYVPDDALVTVEDDDRLTEPAASAYQAMKAAAAAAGVSLSIVEPAGAYRPFWVQQDMHDNPLRWNLNPANVVTLAKAGYSSHGWGDRFDCNAAALSWVLQNGERFGFTREFGAKDPNHFRHDGVDRGFGASGGGRIPTKKEITMLMVCNGPDTDPNKQRYLIYPTGELPPEAISAAQAGYFRSAGVTEGALEPQQYLWMIEWGKQRFAARQSLTGTGGGEGGLTAAQVAAEVDKVLADDFRNVLTAVSGVDEATLTAFGLQRIPTSLAAS